jgi:hypothetical protein
VSGGFLSAAACDSSPLSPDTRPSIQSSLKALASRPQHRAQACKPRKQPQTQKGRPERAALLPNSSTALAALCLGKVRVALASPVTDLSCEACAQRGQCLSRGQPKLSRIFFPAINVAHSPGRCQGAAEE